MKPKRLWFYFQIIVTLGLIFLLLRNFDWVSFGALIQQIPLWFYPLSLGLLFAGQVAYTIRWYIVLRSLDVEVSLIALIEQYLIAIFFSNFLPTAIGGDWSRIYYLGQKKGYINAGASVFTDRFLGFFSMTILATLIIWMLNLTTPTFIVARDLLTIGSVGFVCGFIAIAMFPIDGWIVRLASRYPALSKFGKAAAQFLVQIRQANLRPRVLVASLIMVMIYFGLLAITYQTFFALAGSDVNILPLIAALMSIAILTNIPITVNGIGLREQLHWVLFTGLGIQRKEVSVSISLILLFDFIVISVVGYILWLRMKVENRLALDAGAKAQLSVIQTKTEL